VNRRPIERVLWSAAIVFPVVAVVVSILAVRVHNGRSDVPAGAVIQDFVATPVAEDRPAPAFDLPSLIGTGRVSLAAYRGRVVVLNIWASWCDPCRREASAFEQLAKRHREVVVLGVDHEDSRGDALAFRRRHSLTYPMAFDPNGSVAAAYGAAGLPTTYVIDASGTIRVRCLGRVTAAILGRAVEDAAAGPAGSPSR
jgi:cytochrome c biogenesis protein CcmG, thiol:disulfide interchange protein DsbE